MPITATSLTRSPFYFRIPDVTWIGSVEASIGRTAGLETPSTATLERPLTDPGTSDSPQFSTYPFDCPGSRAQHCAAASNGRPPRIRPDLHAPPPEGIF